MSKALAIFAYHGFHFLALLTHSTAAQIPPPPPPTPAAVSTVPSSVAYSYPYSAYVALPIVTPYADGNHYDGLIAALLTLRSWTCAMELIELVYALATAPITSAGDHAPGAESNKPSTAKSSGSTVPGTSTANPFSDKVAAVVAKLSADLNKGGSNGAEANHGGGSANESKKPSGPASDEAVKKPTVFLDLRTWVQYELSTPVIRDAYLELLVHLTEDTFAPLSPVLRNYAAPSVYSTGTYGALYSGVASSDHYIPYLEERKSVTLGDFPTFIEPYIEPLGHNVYHNPRLYSRLCRIFGEYIRRSTVEEKMGVKLKEKNEGEAAVAMEVEPVPGTSLSDSASGPVSVPSPNPLVAKAGETPQLSEPATLGSVESLAGNQKNTTGTTLTGSSETDPHNSNAAVTVATNGGLESVVRMISKSLLPALSCSDSNPALAMTLWQVIQQLPFELRFSIYDVWKGLGLGKDALKFVKSGSSGASAPHSALVGLKGEPLVGPKHCEIILAEVNALHGARGHLKRLAKENSKAVGRQLSKVLHSNAMVAYTYIFGQIEAFDNLINLVVEALRHSTALARDVFAFMILTQLNKNEDKLKKGDTHYSQWFSALSRFIASFYRRYPQTEIKGLFHFLLRRLASGESLDLLVLKDLLLRMGGCETVLEVSQKQLEGLQGVYLTF